MSNEEIADVTKTGVQSVNSAPNQHQPIAQITTVVDDFADRTPISGAERTTGDWINDYDDMPVRLWYLRNREAQGPHVPLPNHQVMMKNLPPRKPAAYRRSGHSCKDIMRIIKDAPARPTGLSNRVQRYFAWEGMESESKGHRRSLTIEAIRGLMKLSNVKIFYGVRGKVKRGEYEMTEPDDAFQGTKAKSSTRVPLQAPKDVEWWLRQALMDEGIMDFPTFPEFLQRNMDIALHFKLDPMTGLPINGPAQHPPAHTPQAVLSKARSRKRAADDNVQAAPGANKKRKIARSTTKDQVQAQLVQRNVEQPLSQSVNSILEEDQGLQMNEHSAPGVYHGSSFSPSSVTRPLRTFEESLYDPDLGPSFDDQQHFGRAEFQYGFPAHGTSSERREYDPGYANASIASQDMPSSFDENPRKSNFEELLELFDPNSSFDEWYIWYCNWLASRWTRTWLA